MCDLKNNKKTLVIHPKDSTTDFLKPIYENTDWTIINETISKSKIKNQIEKHDIIIMLGHGFDFGLLDKKSNIVIGSNLVYLLREKICIGIWCNADKFFSKYKLIGFHTGMFISDEDEAKYYGISHNKTELDISNSIFADAVKQSIESSDILNNVKRNYVNIFNLEVIDFNKSRLYETKIKKK